MIKYYCDLCGKEIPEYREHKVSIKENCLSSTATLNYEICHDCMLWVFNRMDRQKQLKEQDNE